MALEVGDEVLCIWDGEMWQAIEGHVPEIGENVLCKKIQGKPSYAVMGLGTLSVGDTVQMFPGDFGFDFPPFTIQPFEFVYEPGPNPEDPWDWNGWSMSYGFYASHNGYYLIKETLDDGSGRFGIYLYVGGDGCWSSVQKIIPGTYSRLRLDFIVSQTTVPGGKYTEILVDGLQVYREVANDTGMEHWVNIDIPIPETTNPDIKIICDCPIAYHGTFALTIANLTLS